MSLPQAHGGAAEAGPRPGAPGPAHAVGLAASGLGVAFSLFHLYTAYRGPFAALQQRSIHLSFVLALVFLVFPWGRRAARERKHPALLTIDVVLALAGVGAAAYVFFGYETLSERMGSPAGTDTVLGTLVVLLVLEATRRLIGWPLPAIALAFLAYGFLGPMMPGPLAHEGYDLARLASHLYLTTEGIFGIPLGVSATFVVPFVIFGAVLQACGGGQFFIDLANAIFGRFRGGPAKIAVVSSSLFGMISGSAVANAASVGPLTIPVMVRGGFRRQTAAAIESVASCGGQIMPPVMGAAAFLIAELLAVPYLAVCLAAAIPAILYYLAAFLMVDFEARREGIPPLARDVLPRLWAVLRRDGHLVAPPLVLILALAVFDYSPQLSAFYAIVAALVAAALRPHSRLGARQIVRALEAGGRGSLEVAAACACAGIVIGVIMLTGLGVELSGMLVDLARGNLFVLLILTMVASLLLGTGLPTTPTYILLAILVVPAMVKMGVAGMAAHLFVFYYGAISDMTPPLAISATLAAGIAQADPFKTTLTACRIGLAGYLIPFMFVYDPALLFHGSWGAIAVAGVAGGLAALALAAGVQGFLLRPASAAERAALMGAAVALTCPGLGWRAAGAALLAAMAAVHLRSVRTPARQVA